MLSICGTNCCKNCRNKENCKGCRQTGGHPFGGQCVAANWIQQFGKQGFEDRKKMLIDEINALGIKDLSITDLHLLNGFYINLEYPLPNGKAVKLLADENIYWGNQIERTDTDRCYGLAADDTFLLVCEYGCGGSNPEILLYRKRK